MSFSPRIAIISIGNPNALFNTFHSAGHHALEALRTCMHPPPPRFQRSAHGAEPCMATQSPDGRYSLIQSPTFMNVSGPFVARTWKEVATQAAGEGRLAGLVVLHDELEQQLGGLQMRGWDAGTRGHNGLRSIRGALDYAQWKGRGVRWVRVGVGIGRPESRESDAVREHVLGKMGRRELGELAGLGGRLWEMVQRFEQEWEREMGAVEKQAEEQTTNRRATKARDSDATWWRS